MIETCDGSVSGTAARALREADAARRERVDRRRQPAPDAIRAQRVDGDEDDVGVNRCQRRRGAVTG